MVSRSILSPLSLSQTEECWKWQKKLQTIYVMESGQGNNFSP
jgi:hypothetical protein